MSIQLSRLEARIVRILVDWYPITVEELRDELGLRKDVLDRTLKSLMLKGVVQLEPLPDKVYVRLIVQNIDLKAIQIQGKRRRDGKSPAKSDEDRFDSMYR
ncbi:MAG TPA: hypothetical protein VJ489_04090 [Thermoplasmata archaeon]|nr:hypothetical protein [Thermoplasmata archaeon]